MNGLPQRLLLLLLLPLATVSSVCAESVAIVPTASEAAPIAPSAVEAPPSVPVEQGVVPAAATAPAMDAIKVSRFEPGVASPAVTTAEDRQLQQRKTDFLKFATKKIQDMNRNHILSRERMRIEKRPDGSYKASFHQLDDSSMSCQVSRSPSKGAQYVAVLSYKEQVYTASCRTPAECRQGEFSPAEVIPNRHIFVYSKGGWQ